MSREVADLVSSPREGVLVNSIISLNKPSGQTSQQIVSGVKRILGVKKAGHTGTLDPLATGLLLVCLNEATKISRFLLDMDKSYRVTMKFGERTDTLDADGAVIEKKDISSLSEADVSRTVGLFIGTVRQTPPMYSALKREGTPLHELARRGVEIERAEREVSIRAIRIRTMRLPYAELDVSCSKGTYIRTLCDDIGTRLGVGAHVVALERTAIGPFTVDSAASIDDLRSFDGSQPSPWCSSIDAALSSLREVMLAPKEYSIARNGGAIRLDSSSSAAGEFVRLKDPSGRLFAVGRLVPDAIRIERIMHC